MTRVRLRFSRRFRRARRRNPEEAFPAEVHALRRRGIPLPDWFSGALYPEDGWEEAKNKFEAYRKRAPTGPEGDPEA